MPIAPSPIPILADEARAVLARTKWSDAKQSQLSRDCRALLAQLSRGCPTVVADRALGAGEVAGKIALDVKTLQGILGVSLGAQETPQTVWSDGVNELLVDLAKTSIVTVDGGFAVSVAVSCVETGAQTIRIRFACGSPNAAAGLIFATDTVPDGPAQIVDIWGEALVAFAWTGVLRMLTTLADVSGSDRDGAGLVPANFAVSPTGVELTVMGRHPMDSVVK
jgi:hypothetical protein